MSLALPGSRNIFSQLQHALLRHKGKWIALRKGTHNAIADFRWLLTNISSRPTRIAEIVPLKASALGHHDASELGAGGAWFPHTTLTPRIPYKPLPILWRYEWPQTIKSKLQTASNPTGTITNSDLELAGGLLHLDALAHTYDIRESTVLSKTDNLATLFWQRKGSTSTDKVPAYLLRLFGTCPVMNTSQTLPTQLPTHYRASSIYLTMSLSHIFNLFSNRTSHFKFTIHPKE